MAIASTSQMTHTASFRGPLPDEPKPPKYKHSYKLPRMVEGFAKVVKYALFLANVIILICGITVFAIGVWTLADRAFMERLLGSDFYVSSASILVATGVIVTLISFLGCFGAIKEIKCMLLTFFIILFMIFIIMLVGGILGYVFRKEVDSKMKNEMLSSINKYGVETPVTDAWDDVQRFFKCCGMARSSSDPGYTIWQQNEKLSSDGKRVPYSCCKDESTTEKIDNCQRNPSGYIYEDDCFVEMKVFVEDHALILGGIGIGISCVLIVGMMLSCALFLLIN